LASSHLTIKNFTISAEIMYPITIITTSRRNEIGSGLNPKIMPSGVKGKISVRTTVERVATNRYFDGLLLKKGFRLRMTSTISDAEQTDSKNHPVRNRP